MSRKKDDTNDDGLTFEECYIIFKASRTSCDQMPEFYTGDSGGGCIQTAEVCERCIMEWCDWREIRTYKQQGRIE